MRNEPVWPEAILRALLTPRDRDTIAGDLIEEYRETVLPAKGVLRARIWYCRQVWSFLGPTSLPRLSLATASAASGIRTAGDAWLVFRIGIFWLTLFGIVAALTARAPVFNPLPLIAAFLLIVPMAGFEAAIRTGLLRTGSTAGLLIGTLMLLVVIILRVPHPPGAYLLPPLLAVILGTVGAIFGKRFTGRNRMHEATRLFAV